MDIAPVLDACCCTARMSPTGYPSCGPSHSNSGQHLGYREIRVERGEGLISPGPLRRVAGHDAGGHRRPGADLVKSGACRGAPSASAPGPARSND